MIRPRTVVLLFFSLAAPSAVGEAPPPADPVAALEGGEPLALPESGAVEVVFPWSAKQSAMFLSDALAGRIVGIVRFSVEREAPLGKAARDAKGAWGLSFSVPVESITTGCEERDQHLRAGNWLSVTEFPEASFEARKVERLRPTVWRVEGTFTLRGVSRPLVALANVRRLDSVEGLGRDVARVRIRFPVRLTDFGVDNPYVGTPAVSDDWTLDLDLLGLVRR